MGLTRISDVGRWTACEAWAMTGQDAWQRAQACCRLGGNNGPSIPG